MSNSLLPKIWLMTDERNDAVLENAIKNLPSKSGIVFRHYHLGNGARLDRFNQISLVAGRGGHMMMLAGEPTLARAWGADGVHGRNWKASETGGLIRSAPVHNAGEIGQANENQADLFFLSPVFTTRSHREQKPLGAAALKRLIKLCDGPVILLGGMNSARFDQLSELGVHGWAGLMCVPPAGVNAVPYFALLSKLAKDSGFSGLSMGMSADFESAIKLGATHVRVGTALFGAREITD